VAKYLLATRFMFWFGVEKLLKIWWIGQKKLLLYWRIVALSQLKAHGVVVHVYCHGAISVGVAMQYVDIK
jgi:hypothetical protein